LQFYVLPPHPIRPDPSRGGWDAFKPFRELPEVFYLPEFWTEEDRLEWQSLDPQARLMKSTAMEIDIDNEITVLPFAVEIPEPYRRNPEVDGLKTAVITLLLGPRPYVGYTDDMRKDARRTWNRERQRGKTKTTFEHRKGWHSYESLYRVNGNMGIVRKMEHFYRECQGSKEDCLTTMGILMRKWLNAAHEAAGEQIPSGSS